MSVCVYASYKARERERERERESKHESEGVAIYVYVQSKCISNNSTTPKTTPFILGEFQYNKVRAHITHTHNTHLPYILRALLQLFQLRHRVMPQRFVQCSTIYQRYRFGVQRKRRKEPS